MAILIGGLLLNGPTAKGLDFVLDEENPLLMPSAGEHGLRILSPTLLELILITSKDPDPAPLAQWDFVRSNLQPNLPLPQDFSVLVNGQAVSVQQVGFKRRAIYAPLKRRDLRVGNFLYLRLNQPIQNGQSVEVRNPNGRHWGTAMNFQASADPQRYSPAIHVNQVGYMPGFSKTAMVGYYLGNLGEMAIPFEAGFKLIEAASGKEVFSGPLQHRPDRGYTYSPTPYQAVYEADFTAFDTPGEYRLQVPGLGVSFPFLIHEGTAAVFARTYALGLYHQRCGTSNELPFTRCPHAACHTAPADVPTLAFKKTQEFLAGVTADFSKHQKNTTPQLKDVNSSLYPFVRQGKVDVSGGHHDAGDYSKYTINSAGLIHHLVFAADAFPGVGALDNLGLPESGDGKSDILQKAKWEADFLAKMQDDDGGFYFLVYPRDRKYEDNVLPDRGDPQVVWPKNTAVTAAAVAALAETASSPLFKKQFPKEAALYMEKARLGWKFLETAIARHGKDGAYQKITHYGQEFRHDDELAWAAAAMFAATGEQVYHERLKAWYDPSDSRTRRWGWWRLYEGYGCAARTYAFAARTGRLSPSQLDPVYLAKCEAEIRAAAQDHLRASQQTSYGASFPEASKLHRTAGWFFSTERAFDMVVAYQIDPRPQYLDAIIQNLNFEAGCNPINMSYITGLGWRRQRDIVHHYAQNDRRILPPSGLPLGNVQAGFMFLFHYKGELNGLTFPSDHLSNAPYPFFDRWGDSFNVNAEFVIMDQARSLGTTAFLMAMTSYKDQSWRAAEGEITGLPTQAAAETPVTATLDVPGIDLTHAQIIWEARDQEPGHGLTFTFSPKNPGDQWVEAEALLPDGRRIFAETKFTATTSVSVAPNGHQSSPVQLGPDVVALFPLDDDLADATGRFGSLTLSGNARLDASNVGWMAARSGSALRFDDLGDRATLSIPSKAIYNGTQTSAIILEAMIYVNQFKAYNQGNPKLLALTEKWDAYLELMEDAYKGPFVKGGAHFSVSGTALTSPLKTKEWHHISMALDRKGYTLRINGAVVAVRASSEIQNWGRSANVVLELGNFDGWIDDVVIRSAGTTQSGPAPEPPNQPPLVALTSPTSNSAFDQGSNITLTANATDPDGTVVKVEFFAGTTKVAERTSNPWSVTWNAVPAGSYALTARATDNAGATTTSAPVSVTVNSPDPSMAAAPAIIPDGGQFLDEAVIQLQNATPGAQIRYTTNGSEPTTASPLYQGPFTLVNSATVKARAFSPGMTESPVASAAFTIIPPNSRTQVEFVRVDSTTKGNWKGMYGAEGFQIVGNAATFPPEVRTTVTGTADHFWSQIASDPRALLKFDGTGRIASSWTASSSFNIDLNFNDEAAHLVALYFLDWDRMGRLQTVEILDPSTNTLLDVQTVSSFQEGKYLVWNIKGHVRIRVSRVQGPNAVLSGFFLGTAANDPSVSFVSSDTATQGDWKGIYGADGYHVIGNAADLPGSGKITVSGKSDYTWSHGTNDRRALQKATASDRIASCWYAGTEFTLNVNLSEFQVNRLALYFLDWDRQGRVQTVEILDAATGEVLDEKTVSDFQNGVYLVWDIRGRVLARISRKAGPNAVLMGMFIESRPAQVGHSPSENITTHLAVSKREPAGITLNLQGAPGTEFEIQASADLINWSTIRLVRLTSSEMELLEQTSNTQGHRFYRAVPIL